MVFCLELLCASANWKSVRGVPGEKSLLFVILISHKTHGGPKTCENEDTRPNGSCANLPQNGL